MNNTSEQKIILFIEDNPLLLKAYKEAFEKENIEVCLACDGESGLNMVKEKKPKVVVLDLFLHGANGLEILKSIKNDPSTKEIRVIIFTASEEKSDLEEAMKLGADKFLVKSECPLSEVVKIVLEYVRM
ncbi:MAG: response regulator [Candidatus Pacebacteria bacterium]|nr:response regulator [Candidatus Paceibacterota bacterium]